MLLHNKGNYKQGEKTALRFGENNSKRSNVLLLKRSSDWVILCMQLNNLSSWSAHQTSSSWDILRCPLFSFMNVFPFLFTSHTLIHSLKLNWKWSLLSSSQLPLQIYVFIPHCSHYIPCKYFYNNTWIV